MNKKIMLVLARTMGDVILCNSLTRNIKDYYGEDTEISLYVNEMYKELVYHNPDIERIYTNENWLSKWNLILEEVVKGEFTKIMIPQQTNWEDTIWHQMDYLRHNHMLNYYQLRCGLPVRKTPLIFYPDPHVRTPKQIDGKYIIMHCQSGNPDKDFQGWPFLNRSLEGAGYELYQVGGDADIQFVESKKRFKGTYSEIWKLINNADAFIGLDSGLSMLAATTGTKVFALYGSTIPKTSGAYGDNVYHIVSKPCATCRPVRTHSHCKSKPRCIDNLDPDRVSRLIKRETAKTQKIESLTVQ